MTTKNSPDRSKGSLEGETDANISSAIVAQRDVVAQSVLPMEEVSRRLAELQQFVRSQMIEGVDYGTIPGTQRPTLLKPGAEKLAYFYGLATEFVLADKMEDWEKGLFGYVVRCDMVSLQHHQVIASGLGEANTYESRYRYRWVWPDKVPPGLDATELPRDKHKRVRIPNDDPYSLRNTVLKMAKKRALVDAVLIATRSSGLFTQDVEDLVDSEIIDVPAHTEKTPPKATKTPDPAPANPPESPQEDRSEASKAFLRTWGDMAGQIDRQMVARCIQVMTGGKKVEQASAHQLHLLTEFLKAVRQATELGWSAQHIETVFNYVYPKSGGWTDKVSEQAVQAIRAMPPLAEGGVTSELPDDLPEDLPF